MKTLLILRHAKSSWDDAELADFERPLNARGRRDAPRMGRLLRREDLIPELIVSSAAARARATAEAVALACGYDNQIVYTRDLYHAAPEEYVDVLRTVDEQYTRVMVVGHNPGIEELVETLSGEWERMQTAALALIALPIERWQDLDEETEGELQEVWRPKELDDAVGG